MTLLLAGCTELPESEWEQLQNLRGLLRGQDVAPFAPPGVDKFEDQYWRLRRAWLAADGSLLLPGEESALQQRFEICLGWGRLLLEHSQRNRRAMAARQDAEMQRIVSGLEASRPSVRWNTELRALLTAAELELQLARTEWEAGNLMRVDEVLDKLRQTYEAFESQVATTEERFSDPVLRDIWNSWVRQTVDFSRRNRVAAVIVDKRKRLAKLYRNGRALKTYEVDLGWNPIPDKLHQGDGATPEGFYKVLQMKGPRDTKYHRALLLDYPNQRDQEVYRRAAKNGEIPHGRSIGGLIEIHGDGGRRKDWTDGCVALTNEEMRELFDAAYKGMPVTIVGTHDEDQ